MKSKHLIFDFDGTLADSMQVYVSIFNTFAIRDNFPLLTTESIAELRKKTYGELFKYLKLPFYKLPGYLMEARNMLIEKRTKLEIFPEIAETLKELSKKHTLYLLTSNDLPVVEAFLKRQKLTVFEHIASEKNLFRKDRGLLKIIKHYNLDPQNTWYIGDEMRDMNAARKVGIHSVAVTWGFHDKSILETASANHIVDTPKQLAAVMLD
ncbi:MAG: HAD-IIIA family hydrolase [Weeksellaceae bacterium]